MDERASLFRAAVEEAAGFDFGPFPKMQVFADWLDEHGEREDWKRAYELRRIVSASAMPPIKINREPDGHVYLFMILELFDDLCICEPPAKKIEAIIPNVDSLNVPRVRAAVAEGLWHKLQALGFMDQCSLQTDYDMGSGSCKVSQEQHHYEWCPKFEIVSFSYEVSQEGIGRQTKSIIRRTRAAGLLLVQDGYRRVSEQVTVNPYAATVRQIVTDEEVQPDDRR